MRIDDTLTDWIGEDAARRLQKIPAVDVPAVMDWVMDTTEADDDRLSGEIQAVLTGLQLGPLNPAPFHDEFKNSVLYHEARKRHLALGHEQDCIADTAYSKAVKRLTRSDVADVPCECGGVALAGDWEALRRLFISANWTAVVKTLPNGSWMDLQRGQDMHMALFRPHRPSSLHQAASLAYDPARKAWFLVTEQQQITLAWQPPDRFYAAVKGIASNLSVSPPPYLHAMPDKKVKVPSINSGRTVRVENPLAQTLESLHLPISDTFLTDDERLTAHRLLSASPQAFCEALLRWLQADMPDPRVFLSGTLINRTCTGLATLPAWCRKLPEVRHLTGEMRKRRAAILKLALDALGLEKAAPWPPEQTNQPAPAPPVAAPPTPPPVAVDRPRKKTKPPRKQTGMRMEASRILAELFPDEWAALCADRTTSKALLKLKENHYQAFNILRWALKDGHDPEAAISLLPEELKKPTA